MTRGAREQTARRGLVRLHARRRLNRGRDARGKRHVDVRAYDAGNFGDRIRNDSIDGLDRLREVAHILDRVRIDHVELALREEARDAVAEKLLARVDLLGRVVA